MIPVTVALLTDRPPDERLAWWQDRPVDRDTFLGHVQQVAGHLPARRWAVNLCSDRYLFMVAFAAVLVRAQTSLLPSSQAQGELQRLTAGYADAYRLTDADLSGWLQTSLPSPPVTMPLIAADHIAAIAFTSGSTGQPQPHPKRWDSLVAGAQLAQHRFGFGADPLATLVATVPPQHMYGLETSIMMPLMARISMHSGRPLFPEDIRRTLAAVPAPRILITTPLHLRACVKAELRWPAVAFIISATAPLSTTLAAQAEQAFVSPVLEIYGCTEAGSVASRRTVAGECWRLYDGLTLANDRVAAAHLPEPVPLNDCIAAQGSAAFRLVGRPQDLVNIAGKRSSLAYLNQILLDIAGVEDGAFVLPDASLDEPVRLAALVVAPDLSDSALLAALAERLDPAFLPRPLLRLAQLPRNATGKLTRQALLQVLATRRRVPVHR
jgi:acyl-coenzyme A synthetase/AMP-(fatty) acid ligase